MPYDAGEHEAVGAQNIDMVEHGNGGRHEVGHDDAVGLAGCRTVAESVVGSQAIVVGAELRYYI